MALIKCSECGRDVSDKASTCPTCGNPIATAKDVAASGTSIITTQATARKYKGQMLAGVGLCGLGAVFLVSGDSGMIGFGTLLFVGGLLVYGGARFFAWWRNG